MRDVLDAIEGWRAEGHRFALATVTKFKGSAPRPPGPPPNPPEFCARIRLFLKCVFEVVPPEASPNIVLL